MPVQGGNRIDHFAAYEGMHADGELINKVSKLNTGTTSIPFGYGVVTDAANPDQGALLPTNTSTAAKFIGIAYYELNRAYNGVEAFGAVAKRDFDVVTSGVVWVKALTNVAKDDPVYLVIGDGTGTNQGRFSNAAGTGASAGVLIPNAKWVSAAAAGSLAKISLVIGG